MTDKLETFNAHRRHLMAVAYRMLGTRADAEDVLQEAWLRWQATEMPDLRSAEAWLMTITTRLCIDRLRTLRTEREHYTGPWLPEPTLDASLFELASPDPTPEHMVELASDLSVAFLAVLERLSPDERAAFLLREVFDFDYDEIAEMLERNEVACRQLVHRAKTRVHDERPRITVNREAHRALLDRFRDAARTGERTKLEALFATDAQFVADGGGKVLSVLKALHGAERIVRFFEVVARRAGEHLSYQHALINGEPGLLRYWDGKLDAVMTLITDGEQILACYILRNPEKLANVPAAYLDEKIYLSNSAGLSQRH
ncbi:RNA polymerase sigma-70 factor [Uliginosibacterium sp. H3]|uniref:RNA polymerase sigma-70 factor n=1 Tax=Uliginosibacterium silvisoli TaxID=3114758 RepID=A0ABU6JYB3_9RHOO|nr:RNA polymerase sigma-70 factor [Uliginosibacterium sp. H3]